MPYVITVTPEAAERVMSVIPETAFRTLADAEAWLDEYVVPGVPSRVWEMRPVDGGWRAFEPNCKEAANA